MGISTTTLANRIRKIARKIVKPFICKGKIYEMDELRTFVRNKTNRYWVAYTIRRDTKEVVEVVKLLRLILILLNRYKMRFLCFLILLQLYGCTNQNVVKEFYSSGNLKMECEQVNGKKDGKCKEYYEDGHLKSESQWKEGVQDDSSKFYYENGNIKSVSNWENGKLNGISKFYFPNGNLKLIRSFRNGLPNGYFVSYYENGNKDQEGSYRDGIRSGVLKTYNTNDGKIASEDFFINFHGQEHNIGWVEYNSDGIIKNESRRVSITSSKDTILLGQEINVTLILKKPYFDSTEFIFGKFDSTFILKDSLSLDTVKAINHQALYKVRPDKKGINYLRGYADNFQFIERNKEFYKRKRILYVYFEYSYFVK